MSDLLQIEKNIMQVLNTLPPDVQLEAAAKTRSAEEVKAAIKAGISIIGYNYVQEAERMRKQIDAEVSWHMIGHLQRSKVKKAVKIFDMIETLDSIELAALLNAECEKIGVTMQVLVEVNSGEERQKSGVTPLEVESLIRRLGSFRHIRVKGLMTMGPWVENPEELRPCFRLTKRIYDHLRTLNVPHLEMIDLSMGMSDSYRVAIEEGANIVRLGTILFGPRSRG
ncbi:YggS family pyridoxal phosphate-dependent enzyme [candidate division KSB1 bacterium]|nr:YggS family pyridoxal phosphate-dependent enzyme [candidate division KSB1 bacterium]